MSHFLVVYEKDSETGEIDFSHNPFSMPQGGIGTLFGDRLNVLGQQYDLICNRYEIVFVVILNHRPDNIVNRRAEYLMMNAQSIPESNKLVGRVL